MSASTVGTRNDLEIKKDNLGALEAIRPLRSAYPTQWASRALRPVRGERGHSAKVKHVPRPQGLQRLNRRGTGARLAGQVVAD